MLFRNAIFYRLTAPMNRTAEQLNEAMAAHAYTPCSAHELARYGWVPPLADLDSTLAHEVHGAIVICGQAEEKIIPPAEVQRAVKAKVAEIEQQQGRKVYKKERDQLKDEVIANMLPRAFSRITLAHALIIPQHNWVIVNASSHKKAEALLSFLRGTLGTLPVALPDVKHSPSAIMSHWVEQPEMCPADITVLDEAEMRDNLVENGSIRIKGQELCNDEFTAHLEAGKRVVKLAIAWQDTLQFKLDEYLTLKQIKYTDDAKAAMDTDDGDNVAAFDAVIAYQTLEFTRLLPALIEAFGGMAEQ